MGDDEYPKVETNSGSFTGETIVKIWRTEHRFTRFKLNENEIDPVINALQEANNE